MTRIVVVGAGHASGQLLASLKQCGFDGEIEVFGEETYLPYQRPPLSKKFLAGEMPAERLYFKPAGFYNGIATIHTGVRIETIDRERQQVTSTSGDAVHYDQLVLATGSRVRRLQVPGGDLAGVHYLRTIDDVEAIRADTADAQRVVIVGAGYIGLEVAAVLRSAGVEVCVVELADRVMSRVVSPEMSDFYQLEHHRHGVELRLATGVSAIVGEHRVAGVVCDDDELLPADAVVVGVGILPNTELAEAAGLRIDDGIAVDERCRSSDRNIFAIGDCTSHPSRVYGRRLRLESVQNALQQAKTAAANLCGRESVYDDVPWFWSDQYDLKLQIAGLSAGYDEVVLRGDPASRSFACLYLKNDRLIATDAVNAPRDFIQSKAIIAAAAKLPRERLADCDVELKALAD